MTQESGGADPQINPPSFIPSAGRRSRASSQTPRTITPSSSSRTPRAAGGNDNGIPPSFSPNVNRSARRSTSASSQPQSIPPTQARRSSGSSRNASTPASSVIRSATLSRTPVVAMTSGHNSAIAIRGRGHKVRNGVIGAVKPHWSRRTSFSSQESEVAGVPFSEFSATITAPLPASSPALYGGI